MASPRINPAKQDEVYEMPLEEYKLNSNENKIILHRFFSTEDSYGEQLLHYESSRLSIAPSDSQETKANAEHQHPSPIPSGQGIITGHNSIVYFDTDTLEKLELYQTRQLQEVTDAKTVAVHWSSLSTQEKLKESLITIYAQLRNIERVIIVTDPSPRRASTNAVRHHTSSLGLYAAPSETMLEYENALVSWSTIGKEVQNTLRDNAFWRECNRRYALEQILPIRTRFGLVPRVCLGHIASCSNHEGDPCLPSQLTSLAQDVPSSAGIGELGDPQMEDKAVGDYSLQDLLD